MKIENENKILNKENNEIKEKFNKINIEFNDIKKEKYDIENKKVKYEIENENLRKLNYDNLDAKKNLDELNLNFEKSKKNFENEIKSLKFQLSNYDKIINDSLENFIFWINNYLTKNFSSIEIPNIDYNQNFDFNKNNMKINFDKLNNCLIENKKNLDDKIKTLNDNLNKYKNNNLSLQTQIANINQNFNDLFNFIIDFNKIENIIEINDIKYNNELNKNQILIFLEKFFEKFQYLKRNFNTQNLVEDNCQLCNILDEMKIKNSQLLEDNIILNKRIKNNEMEMILKDKQIFSQNEIIKKLKEKKIEVTINEDIELKKKVEELEKENKKLIDDNNILITKVNELQNKINELETNYQTYKNEIKNYDNNNNNNTNNENKLNKDLKKRK